MSTPDNAPPPEAAPTDGLPCEGDVLAGKYRVERIIGQGGMGVVVAAQHTTLRQTVAIKILLPDAAQRKDAAERFVREARAAVSIQNEHVARVTDVGAMDSGLPYMVMEYLTGKDLGELLHDRGPLPVPEAVDYILQACEAIAEAHSLGIIHRDLKPANLFITTRTDGAPLVKVLDFGLSKLTKDTLDASLTQHNVVMGSPCYMSPEQIRSLKGLDARTDIWALGVILYQILTGARPFEAPSLGALFFTIGADSPKPPRERRPDLPAELEAAVLKCLDKDAARRTQTIAELARSIAPFGKPESFVSVDRIHRLLNEATPFPVRHDSIAAPPLPSTIPLDEEIDDNALTLAQPLPPLKTESLRPPAPPPAAYPPSPAYGGPAEGLAPRVPSVRPPMPSQPAQPSQPSWPPQAPGSDVQVKSGSMAAIAKDGSSPPPPTTASPPPRRSSLATIAIGVALVAIGGVAGLGLRSVTAPPAPAPTGIAAGAQLPPVAPPSPPTAQPAGTALAAPPAPQPSTSASVAPSTSASAPPAPKK